MQQDDPAPTAACLLIGDELLSGRTQDKNAHHLAGVLHERGIALVEIRVVPDEAPAIIEAVQALSSKADLVFTSGGIGPTHDDITADAVARAFDTPIAERDDAVALLDDYYRRKGETLTEARRRMARIPKGAALIENTVSAAPGFKLGNVYVMAGVPAIFSAMLEAIQDDLPRGPEETAFSVIGEAKESTLAAALLDLQTALKGLKIGCYPGPTGTGGPLAVVCRSRHAPTAEQAALAVKGLFAAQGVDAVIEDGHHRPAKR
ncbi:MAG: molybdopterin-binding protein [Pseudomonadota bacterium]